MKTNAGLIGLLLLLLGALLFYRTRDREPIDEVVPSGEAPESASATHVDSRNPESRGRVAQATDLGSASGETLRLRAIERGTRVPVRAVLTLVESSRSPSMATKLAADANGHLEADDTPTLAPTLTLTAYGYESMEVDTGELRLARGAGLTVEMTPARRARVRVVDRVDAPLANVSVLWSPATALGDDREGDRLQSLSGADGLAEVSSAVPLWACAEDTQGRTTQRVRVQPDGPVVDLVLGGSALTLNVYDARSGSPVPALLLRARQSGSGDLLGQPAVTDENGALTLLGFEPPLVLEAPRSNNHTFSRLQSSEFAHVSRNPRLLDVRGHRARSVESIDILVEGCGFEVRCMGRLTGAALDGLFEWRADFLRQDGTWTLGLWTPGDIVSGRASLPCFNLEHPAYSGSRVTLRPEGHASRRVDVKALAATQGSGATPQTVHFERFTPRGLVFLSPEGGAVPVGNVRLVDAATGEPILATQADESGRTPLFHWSGGDLAVRIDSLASGGEPLAPTRDATVEIEVSSADLEHSERATVIVPMRTGTLEILNCPDVHESLIVRTSRGVDLLPTKTGTTLRFENVPLGKGIVGPVPWVDGLWQRAFYGDRTGWFELRTTATLRIPWNPPWAARAELTGQVRFTGELPGAPLLIPVFGPPASRQPMGSRMTHLPITEDGRYRILAGDVVPSLLLICCREEARARYGVERSPFRILGSIEPGQDAEVQLETLRLTWPDEVEWDGPVDVFFELPATRFHDPAGLRVAWDNELGGFAEWRAAEPLRVRGLMGQRVTLRLRSARGGWEETVDLRLARGEHRVSPPTVK